MNFDSFSSSLISASLSTNSTSHWTALYMEFYLMAQGVSAEMPSRIFDSIWCLWAAIYQIPEFLTLPCWHMVHSTVVYCWFPTLLGSISVVSIKLMLWQAQRTSNCAMLTSPSSASALIHECHLILAIFAIIVLTVTVLATHVRLKGFPETACIVSNCTYNFGHIKLKLSKSFRPHNTRGFPLYGVILMPETGICFP